MVSHWSIRDALVRHAADAPTRRGAVARPICPARDQPALIPVATSAILRSPTRPTSSHPTSAGALLATAAQCWFSAGRLSPPRHRRRDDRAVLHTPTGLFSLASA